MSVFTPLETVHWGMIGCGAVTEVKSGPAFYKCAGSTLSCVMRRSGALAADYARRHGVAKWYDDAQRLIEDPQVNAVYVATPPYAHMKWAMAAIDAGKPVYCEKPLTLNYADTARLVRYAQEKGVPLLSAYYRRAMPYFLKIQEIVQSGAIGPVRCVQIFQSAAHGTKVPAQKTETVDWHMRPEISGGGWFHDVACHTLDILDFLLGPIVSAQGKRANLSATTPADDTVCASLRFDGGALGSALWCFDADHTEESVQIFGTKGAIRFGALSFTPIELTTKAGTATFQPEMPEHVQQPLIQSVVDQLRGCGCARSDAQNALRTAWVMDQILGTL